MWNTVFVHHFLPVNLRKTNSAPTTRRWTAGASRRREASSSKPQVPWFPCLGEAWVGHGVPAGPCVCCLNGWREACAIVSQPRDLTSGAAHTTTCSCTSCWASAALCSAWCMRCCYRCPRSPSSSSATNWQGPSTWLKPPDFNSCSCASPKWLNRVH